MCYSSFFLSNLIEIGSDLNVIYTSNVKFLIILKTYLIDY